MKIAPGYYAAYRTNGNGSQLRLLSRRFAVTHAAASPEACRQIADDWMRFEQSENPDKDVVLIQVLEATP